jgi:4-amino-4-deoxy-L-arabinose transferase-like glycosyltransferase
MQLLALVSFVAIIGTLDETSFPVRLGKAACIWTLCLVIIIGALSATRWLDEGPMQAAWGLVVTASVALALGRRGFLAIDRVWWHEARPFLAPLAAVILPTLIIALITLPNTWDALSYHIARVDHWQQNHTVAFFPTLISRQNESQPLAEYVILTFQVLGQNEGLSNAVQWAFMAMSLVLVYGIARALPLTRAAASIAVVFAATIPAVVLEASSTQTDCVAAFWVLCFVLMALHWRHQQRLRDLFFACVALAFAIMTKGSTPLFLAPFGLFLAWDLRKSLTLRTVATLAAGFLLIVVSNLPQAMQNYRAYGTPLGGPNAQLVAVDRVRLSAIPATIIKDIAVQVALPVQRVDDEIVVRITKLSSLVGLDLAERADNFLNMSFALSYHVAQEDTPTGLIQVAIGLFAVGFCVVRPGQLSRLQRRYLFCVLAGFVLFAAFIRWQPYIGRLLLPFAVLLAPITALVAERLFTRRLMILGSAALILSALPFVFLNATKPLVPIAGKSAVWQRSRFATAFADAAEFEAPMDALFPFLDNSGATQIGYFPGMDIGDTWLFLIRQRHPDTSYRIENVSTGNGLVPSAYPLGPFVPDVVVVFGIAPPALTIAGRVFKLVFERGQIHAFAPS